MEQHSSTEGSTNTPLLCSNNCGFYGSPATNNLCSVCFKKQHKISNHSLNFSALMINPNSVSFVSQINSTSATETPKSQINSTSATETLKSQINSVITDDAYAASKDRINTLYGSIRSEMDLSNGKATVDQTEIKPELSNAESSNAKRKPIRCRSCNKRLPGCTAFRCRCGDQFCSLHRYSDKHDCTFDYKARAQDAIAKANPVIKRDKVSRI